MAKTFEGLGLRPELVTAVSELGYREPTTIQGAAIPVLRRGGSALVHAAPGAGTLAAYGLAILDRLAGERRGVGDEDEEGSRALVLVPTADDATRSALSLARLGRGLDLRIAALDGGWVAGEGGTDAEVLFSTPALAVEAIERSRLNLDEIGIFVVDGASAIFALGAGTALDTVASFIPRDTQRIILTAEMSPQVDDYAERYLRRALRIPPSPIGEDRADQAVEPAFRLDYQVVSEWERSEALARLLARGEPGRERVVYVRSERTVQDVIADLELRGFSVRSSVEDEAGPEESADRGVIVVTQVVDPPADALVISFEPPFDPESLRARHEHGGTVLATSRELAHLRSIGRAAGAELRLTTTGLDEVSPEVTEYRARLRKALEEEDIAAQLLILDPLFREFSAAEVAAAASALLRRRQPAEVGGRSTPAVSEISPAAVRPSAVRVATPSAPFVRLFVGVGSRDGIVPSDLVGAITGEAQVSGTKIGKIEIRDTFSIVEVESEIAPRVIQAVNGITLKGRSVRVDFDRRGPSAGGRRGGTGRGGRRIARGPRDTPTR